MEGKEKNLLLQALSCLFYSWMLLYLLTYMTESAISLKHIHKSINQSAPFEGFFSSGEKPSKLSD